MDIPQNDLQALLGEAAQLTEAFARHTREQRALLESQDVDTAGLNASLEQRRQVLARMEEVFGALAALGQDSSAQAGLMQRLADIQAMDDENIKLAEGHMQALKKQARQMTQTRKGVTGYNQVELSGTPPQLFDKKQ